MGILHELVEYHGKECDNCSSLSLHNEDIMNCKKDLRTALLEKKRKISKEKKEMKEARKDGLNKTKDILKSFLESTHTETSSDPDENSSSYGDSYFTRSTSKVSPLLPFKKRMVETDSVSAVKLLLKNKGVTNPMHLDFFTKSDRAQLKRISKGELRQTSEILKFLEENPIELSIESLGFIIRSLKSSKKSVLDVLESLDEEKEWDMSIIEL